MRRLYPAQSENSTAFFFCIALVSILLSSWLQYNESVINTDGVCYILAAKSFSYLPFTSVMKLCDQSKWPLYSGLIYLTSKSLSLSLIHAAYLLNTLFSLVSILAFLGIVRELGGNKNILVIAAFFFFCAHDFNTVRESIIRDHGYWAFYLLAIFCLLRFIRVQTLLMAMIFSASLIIATLFRIEGILFLILTPLVIFVIPNLLKFKLQLYCKLNFVVLMGALCVLVFWLMHPHTSLSRIDEVFAQIQNGFTLMSERFDFMKENIIRFVLTEDSKREAGIVLVLLMLAWYSLKVIQSLGFLYSGLLVFGKNSIRKMIAAPQRYVVYAFIVVNVVITFVFLSERLFLSKRYLIALSLTLLIFIPFIFYAWLEKYPKQRYRITVLFCTAVLISSLGGIIDFGYSKQYLYDAGRWIKNNIDRSDKLFANDLLVMFYSEHYDDSIFSAFKSYQAQPANQPATLSAYDYAAVRINVKAASKSNIIVPGKVVKEFFNSRGDKVVIYKIATK